MREYPMHHYTLTATDERAAANLRVSLRTLTPGWTETPGVGTWHGEREHVTVFTVYLTEGPESLAPSALARRAAAAHDHKADAVPQVTYHGPITLWEATGA